MSHYLDDPEATAAALSADGWLRTGDLGIVDDDGCLRIVGRSKDMFIVGGFNAYPGRDRERAAAAPRRRQAAVIGVPDARLGEVGMAFVVARARARRDRPAAIVEWCRAARWPTTRCRAPCEIVDELPLNATGKVVKDALASGHRCRRRDARRPRAAAARFGERTSVRGRATTHGRFGELDAREQLSSAGSCPRRASSRAAAWR